MEMRGSNPPSHKDLVPSCRKCGAHRRAFLGAAPASDCEGSGTGPAISVQCGTPSDDNLCSGHRSLQGWQRLCLDCLAIRWLPLHKLTLCPFLFKELLPGRLFTPLTPSPPGESSLQHPVKQCLSLWSVDCFLVVNGLALASKPRKLKARLWLL